MKANKCRWGILGAAGIAQKNWRSIRDAGNAELTAVASRDLEKSRDFIDCCSAQVPHPNKPVALGSYEELLAREDVDAVYLPLPTGLRYEWALKVAEAGNICFVRSPAERVLIKSKKLPLLVKGRESSSWMESCSCTASE